MGVDSEKVENIKDYETHPAFNETERAALRFAKALVQDSGNIPDDVCDRFVAAFSAQQRVEIALATAAMDVLNKFNDGLRIPLDEESIEMARIAAEGF